jgi:hypothetical protein
VSRNQLNQSVLCVFGTTTDSAIALAWKGLRRAGFTGLAAVREFEGDEGLVFLEVVSRCL